MRPTYTAANRTASLHTRRLEEEPKREPLSRLGAAALYAMIAASVVITVAGISAIVTMVAGISVIVTMVLSWVL